MAQPPRLHAAMLYTSGTRGSRHTPSQFVSAPAASSPSALVVPAGHATHALPDTLSLSAQRIAVTHAAKNEFTLIHRSWGQGAGAVGAAVQGLGRGHYCKPLPQTLLP